MEMDAQKKCFEEGLGVLAGIAFIGPMLLALAVVGWQVTNYLKFGAWHELPFSIVFQWIGVDVSAVYAPNSWVGLANIGAWVLDTPMSVTLPLVLWLAALAFALPLVFVLSLPFRLANFIAKR